MYRIFVILILLRISRSNEVCYKELGCFPMGYPWFSKFRPLPPPSHPDAISTKLFLYTRKNPTFEYRIELRPQIVIPREADFRRNRNTVFIIHGYMNNANISWMDKMKNAYLQKKNVNVFLVDWMGGAVTLNYLKSASDTRVVGAELARFLQHCVRVHGIKLSTVHLIGHSLGAHIAAYCGKILNGRVGRISGLDPAQPGFEDCDPKVRIIKGDALLVDILHTSSRPVTFGGAGVILASGDIDIYANGGRKQPGCPINKDNLNLNLNNLEDFGKINFFSIGNVLMCDHMRSVEYFAEALESTECVFWAKQAVPMNTNIRITSGIVIPFLPVISQSAECSLQTCTVLGIETPEYPARGVFVMKTNSMKPFCQSDEPMKRIMLLAKRWLKVFGK